MTASQAHADLVPPRQARRRPRRRLEDSPFVWLLPTAVMLGLFYLYPILDAVRLAFTNASLLGGEVRYTTGTITAVLGHAALGEILANTAVFTLASVAGQQALGLAIALLVVRGERRRLPGMVLLRTIVLVAWVIPGIANGIIWQLLFSEAPFGAINGVLRLLHVAPVPWLSDPTLAMVSSVVSNIWRGTAFSMIVFYAALKGIDTTLYEAADMDGASTSQTFRHVTLPLLRPAILVNSILVTIQTLNVFDAIISLTGGGPGRATEVLSLFTFFAVFRNYDLGGASVLSILMLVISLVLAVLYASFLPRDEDRA